MYTYVYLYPQDLSEEEYQQWLVGYDNANLDLENREELVFKCADTIERKLQLLGNHTLNRYNTV